jgi:PAS domain S-box-containing protein
MFKTFKIANSSYFLSLKIAVICAFFAVNWVLFSNQLLLFVSRSQDLETLTKQQTILDWYFVVISAGIIFILLHREMKGHIAAENKFRAIFDNHFQFTGLLNPEGILLSANPAGLALVGAKEEDVLGKPFWDTLWWNHSVDLQRKIKKEFYQAAKGKLVRFEITLPRPDGKTRYMDFSINPVINEDNKIIYLVPEG